MGTIACSLSKALYGFNISDKTQSELESMLIGKNVIRYFGYGVEDFEIVGTIESIDKEKDILIFRMNDTHSDILSERSNSIDTSIISEYDCGAVRDTMNHVNELLYQLSHRKVKDRYSTPKFYMNNFKRRKHNKRGK